MLGLTMIFCLAVPPQMLSAQDVYQALLRGRHEVLPFTTPAFGTITATLDENILTVEGSFSGLTGDFASNVAGGSHIHTAYAGQNGGIAISLNAELDEDLRGGTFQAEDNTFSLTEEQITALTERRMYINIHSGASTSGELRGQLLHSAEAYYYANLLGSNEVPSLFSSGSGALALELDDRTLTVSGSFQGLQGPLFTQAAGGAHLHLGYAGENGAIEISLNATAGADGTSAVFSAADNTFELTPQQVRALEERRLYANIHSSTYPGGELRGQILGPARTVFRAHLSGSNEIPALTSTGNGVVLAELMADDRLILSGNYRNLESQLIPNIGNGGAQVHRGLAGENGPAMFRIFVRPNGALLEGVIEAERNINELTSGQVGALYDRALYTNFYTILQNSGEIRGQLLPESQMFFNGFLSSIFQTNGANSVGYGGVKAELTGTKLTLSGSFAGLSSPVATDIAGGAHIHRGMAGANGPITQPLVPTLGEGGLSGSFAAADNVFELDAEEIIEFPSRGKYVNIHSAENRSGDLRAQLLAEATTYFVAPLSGVSETLPVNTDAVGMAVLEVTGTTGITSGSFNNLSAPLATAINGGAHIHGGLAGMNGSVIFPLNSVSTEDMLSGTFAAADNIRTLSAGFLQQLRNRATYVNVHSTDYLPGEIRGQLLPLSRAYYTANLSGRNSVPPNPSEADGQVKIELNGDEITMSGAFRNLSGDFASAIAGGSHLHASIAGKNGDIQLFTTAELDADLKGGRFLAEDNTFEANIRNIYDLEFGNLYLNIHTTDYTPGEIRGQVLPEINFYPGPEAAVESPASGSSLTIDGDPASLFTVSWAPADDRDRVVYRWQVSTTVAFEDMLLNENALWYTSFSMRYRRLNSILANAGVGIGESITLYHRLVASDGSVATAGPVASVTLTRGVFSAGDGLIGDFEPVIEPIADFRVFPTVVQNRQSLNVQIQAGTDKPAELLLVNQLGQPLQRRSVDLFAGDNRLEWRLPDLAAGFYFVQLRLEGQLLPLERIVVE